MSIQVQQIPAVSLLFSMNRINNLHSSTYTQHNMQIKFCAKLDSLKCQAKPKSMCFLVWECQFLDQHQSKFYFHKLKLFKSVKLLNHSFKAKIECFDKYRLLYFIHHFPLLVVFMLFIIHFELKNCNCLKYRAILPVNENKQKHSN